MIAILQLQGKAVVNSKARCSCCKVDQMFFKVRDAGRFVLMVANLQQRLATARSRAQRDLLPARVLATSSSVSKWHTVL